jgi:hypothetical protein
MFESLASCFAFRCSASLNSPQDESAAADMTGNDLRLLRPLLAETQTTRQISDYRLPSHSIGFDRPIKPKDL